MSEQTVSFTTEECRALYDTIDELSGFNPGNVFAWDETDDIEFAVVRAHAKLYVAAGRSSDVPDAMLRAVKEAG